MSTNHKTPSGRASTGRHRRRVRTDARRFARTHDLESGRPVGPPNNRVTDQATNPTTFRAETPVTAGVENLRKTGSKFLFQKERTSRSPRPLLRSNSAHA